MPAVLPEGASAVPLATSLGPVTTDERAVRTTIVADESWGPSFAGLYDLGEGIAPSHEREALVSPLAAEALGLALGDEVTVPDLDTTFTVAGLLATRGDSINGIVFLTDATALSDRANSNMRWYLPDSALNWEQVQELNAHGLVVYSRSVVLDPPPEAAEWSSGELAVPSTVVLLAGSASRW